MTDQNINADSEEIIVSNIFRNDDNLLAEFDVLQNELADLELDPEMTDNALEDTADMLISIGRELRALMNRIQLASLRRDIEALENTAHGSLASAREAIQQGVRLTRLAEALGTQKRMDIPKTLSDVRYEEIQDKRKQQRKLSKGDGMLARQQETDRQAKAANLASMASKTRSILPKP